MVRYGRLGLGPMAKLGDGGTVNRTYPSQVVLADGSPLTGVVEIMAGYEHSLFLSLMVPSGLPVATKKDNWVIGHLQIW